MHRSSTAQVGFSERNNRYMHKEVLSVLKSNAILGRPFRFGGFPLRIFGIGGPLVTMATQDHNDLLRAGQCPGAPFSLTDTLENRPQSPATQHSSSHRTARTPLLLRGPAHLITIKLSQTSFRNVDRSRAEGINRGYTRVYTCVRVCVSCVRMRINLGCCPFHISWKVLKRVSQPLDIALTAHRLSRFDEDA